MRREPAALFPSRHGGFRALAVLALLLSLPAVTAAAEAQRVAPAALASEHDRAAADGDEAAQVDCLALNVYHEARGESDEGKFAVAMATLNRVHSHEFPDTLCRVVWQRGQFSWTHDGQPDHPYNPRAWAEAVWVAMVTYRFSQPSLIGRATYFHAAYVRPAWSKSKRRVRKVGRHIFYESPEP